jgi:RNA polymerase sigma-70 factor (ECF subfamily)
LNSFGEWNDAELLIAIRNSDERAFSEFFRRYWKMAHGHAYSKTRSKEITEEIVQDLFMMLWDKRESLNIDNIPAYIFTSIKNKSINYIESQFVKNKYLDYYKAFIPQAEESTSHDVEFDELMEAVEGSVESLPEKSRNIFRLSQLEGRSNKEIASTLSLSEKSIEYHLTKSIKSIRLHLKDFICMLMIINLFALTG